MNVFSLPPYYSLFKDVANLYPCQTSWNESLDQDPSTVIEVVCIPNNPDFTFRNATYPSAKLIYDLVYYWPTYVSLSEGKFAEQIMIFSLSKLAGLSARFRTEQNIGN